METPVKKKPNQRFTTTAGTDNYDTILFTLQKERKSRIKTSIDDELSLVKKRIHFQTQKQKFHSKMTTQQSAIQNKFRKNMLTFLNQKFSQAIIINPQIKQNHNKKSINEFEQKYKKQLQYFFKSFLWEIRQTKVEKKLSEFQIGTILHKMQFVKNILDQRDIIKKLYIQISPSTVVHLFMFLAHLSIFPRKDHSSQFSQKVIKFVELLFITEGFLTDSRQLEIYFINSLRASKLSVFNLLQINRQRRPTASSLSKSRR